MPKAKFFTCDKCGEELTCPQFYKGGVYGWSCIKIINPAARKSKDKAKWVAADKFEFEKLERGTKIRAFKNGLKFIDIKSDNSPYDFKNIVVQNGIAFINALVYKNGYKIIE